MQQDISSELCTRVSGFEISSGCCLVSLSNSYQRSSLTTMTEPFHNAASGLPSDLQTPFFTFSGELYLPQEHLQAAAASRASTSFVSHQHQQAASIRDAKMSRMYQFMFTHMRGLESRLNEVARTTSERFSQADTRLQALVQRAVATFRPHESTAEIVDWVYQLEVSYRMEKW